ncbi:MAG: PAS domain S-box protein [Acidimicrobiia bacterium]
MTDDSGVGSKQEKGTVWRRLSPGVVTGVYTAVGAAWIVLSDLFFAALGVDGVDVDISVAKGVGFVVITGLLLFEVLRRRERWLTAARQELTRWVIDDPQLALDELRVLVVDDDPDDRQFLREALAHAVGPKLVVEEVTTLAAARNAILDRAHDIYLVDQRLPGGSGLDLIREFHEVAPGPMILITGTADLDTDLAALQSGAHDYLLKHEIQPSWIGRTIRYAVANWRSRREIARTKQWYSEMVTETPIGLFRSRPDGTLNDANPALVEMFGAQDVDQLRNVGIPELYRDPGLRARLIDRVAAGETIEDELVPMRRIDGTPIDVRMRMRGIRSEDGLIALYGALIDVTDEVHNVRRVAMQASMLDQVENAVVRTGLDGSILYWNRAAERTYGWSADEVIGRPTREVTPAPQESERIGPLLKQLTTEGSWSGEFRCLRKDGSTFPAYVSIGALQDPAGNRAGYVGVTVDLTDLRRAEERAAAQEAMAASVLESVRFPACVLDEAGAIIAVNGAWTGTAIANNADLSAVGVGANYLDVCDRASGDDARIVSDGIRRVLRTDVASFSHEYPCGGEWFRLEVARTAEPLGGAVAMHIDITELRAAARQAEEFARSKDRLIASVSHELRTPLTAVLGFADLIEHPDGLPTEEIAVFAGEIHRQATDMAAIVEDLLVAARAEMGALAVHIQSTDVPAEVNEVVRHLAHRPNVSIETRLAPVPLARADPLRLRQILRNLINNAARYGGGRVVVETRHDDSAVVVRVLDDGAGIAEEHREAIFQPFFSAHDRAGQPDSLGLGLSVVRTLAESMGGSIRVDREGTWTVFELTLLAAARL